MSASEPRKQGHRPETDRWPEFVIPWDDTSESITDMSFLLHKPAGKYGFVEARDGHFRLGNGERWKIWGQNITLAVPCPPMESAPRIARRMAKFGINCLRLHHIDHRWPEGILMRHSSGTAAPIGRDMGVPWDGRGESTRALDPEAMVRLDWFLKCCRDNGIYIDFNLNVSRNFTEADGVREPDLLGFGKASTYFDERLVYLQKEYARQLLTHVNPFTGLRYADDPAVAIVELLNENSLLALWVRGKTRGNPPRGESWSDIPPSYAADLTRRWNERLLDVYKDRATLAAVWDGGLEAAEDPARGTVRRLVPEEFASANSVRFQDEAAFYQSIERAYFADFRRYLREDLGVKPMIIGTSDCFHEQSGLPMLESQATLDIVDGHAYWEGYWATPNLRRNERPAREWYKDWYIRNTPMIEDPEESLPAVLSRSMVKGVPYVVSEINHHFPGDYVSECFPVNTAYALLQDWDGIFWFGYAGGDWEGVFRFDPLLPREMQLVMTQANCRFEWMCNDPVKMTQSAISALMFLRGDVAAARRLIERRYPRAWALESCRRPRPGRRPSPYWLDYLPGSLGLVHRTTIADFHAVEVRPASGEVTVGEGPFASDTGELRWDPAKGAGSVTIDAPRAWAVVAHRGTHETAHLKVTLACDFASVQIASLEEAPLGEARSMLIVAASRVANTGMKWKADGTCSISDQWGGPPTRIEPVAAEVTLRGLAGRRLLLQALDGRGQPTGDEEEAQIKAGEATLRLGVGTPTVWYSLRMK